MLLERSAVPPFFKNGFVLGCEDTRQGVIIDPGDEVEDLLAAVDRHRLTIGGILLTHAHLDHITGVGRAKQATGAPVWLHEADNFLYERILQQALMFGLRVERQPPVDRFYGHGEGATSDGAEGKPLHILPFGRYEARVRHTPGHCPGGVCLEVTRTGEESPTLFVGDTLFAGSIGRVDLPGGDLDTLLGSIRGVLFRFPDDTPVWSGHGELTTIGEERRTNPFLV
jgi:glyoxylase-like metal-dependent hydrolase (beta-lactamase superfamily II)